MMVLYTHLIIIIMMVLFIINNLFSNVRAITDWMTEESGFDSKQQRHISLMTGSGAHGAY
jgi:hypothetical protein